MSHGISCAHGRPQKHVTMWDIKGYHAAWETPEDLDARQQRIYLLLTGESTVKEMKTYTGEQKYVSDG